jgi:hypothetical protein
VSTTTVCAVCEAALADRTCPLCGRTVCDDHFEAGRGACTACLGGADDVGPGGLM